MRLTPKGQRRFGRRLVAAEGSVAFTCLNGHFRRYWTSGRGEPLVVVPGLAGGFELLGPMFRFLGRNRRIYCLEPRGEGAPFVVQPTRSLDELVDEQRSFIQTLGLERVDLLGVSFGATIALKLTARCPGLVRTLVVSGAAAHSSSLAARIACRILERYRLPTDSPFFNRFFRLLFGDEEDVGDLLDLVAQRCWRTGQAIIAQRLALLSDYDVRASLNRIRVPTLVIAGRSDGIIRWEAQLALAEALPLGRFVAIDGAGHLCFVTRPRLFARLTDEFLRAENACYVV